jgi:lipoyl-dependent peroxiredoxin
MKTLFTSEAVARGGRSGKITSPDGLLDVKLGNPLSPGEETAGPNPELLFAAAYSACYQGALMNAGKAADVSAEDSTVRVLVSLQEDDSEGFHLAIEVHAKIPGVEKSVVEDLMKSAHVSCPYSKALRGESAVTLVVD